MLCDNESIIDCHEFGILLDVVDNHDHMPQNTEFQAWLLSWVYCENMVKNRLVPGVSINYDFWDIEIFGESSISTNQDFLGIAYFDKSKFSESRVFRQIEIFEKPDFRELIMEKSDICKNRNWNPG